MTTRNKVEVKVAGKDYVIVGTESEEYIQRVGLYIDRKMNEILRNNNRLSTSMAAVLTAMNVADDFLKTHESDTEHRKEIKLLQDELQELKLQKIRLTTEISDLTQAGNNLKLELAKREAELNEVRNTLEKTAYNKGDNR